MTSSRPIIAVDAMGGDNAPAEIVAGALLAANEYDAEIVLVGDEAQIAPLLPKSLPENVRVVHAPDAVPMDQHASQALRQSATTSLGVAVSMVKSGDADAVVSAGNSGAFLAIALIKLRTIEGIARPAIATVWPALKGPTVLLDSGANVDCRAEWLEQFAIMGSAYAQKVLHIDNPRVALLSVGEERTKGNALVLEAASLLEAAPINFTGNVEGKDMFRNEADVIVADGFVGNVVLKTSEGLISTLGTVIRDAMLGGSIFAKLGAALMLPSLRKLRKKYDYETIGGAPLLGLRGNCIVTHGRASRKAIQNSINLAIEEVRNDVIGKISELVAAHVVKEDA